MQCRYAFTVPRRRQNPGRKLVKIDVEQLEKLCGLQCTDAEIAAWFHVSTRTIENRRQQRKFAEAMERGRAKGRISVRRHQMKQLEAKFGLTPCEPLLISQGHNGVRL